MWCADDVLVEIAGGRFTSVTPSSVSDNELHHPSRAHDPGPRELPQPRLPPGAARPDPAGARVVLDLARADVRRRGRARPRHLLRAGHGHLSRDGRGRDHLRRGVPLPAPPARRDAVRRPQRDGQGADRGGPARPGSGSPCSTPATSPPGIGRPREGVQRRFSDGDVDGWVDRVDGHRHPGPAPDRRRHPLGPGGAARPDAEAADTTRSPLHVHLSEQVAENERARRRTG